jgi:hypothetical protein
MRLVKTVLETEPGRMRNLFKYSSGRCEGKIEETVKRAGPGIRPRVISYYNENRYGVIKLLVRFDATTLPFPRATGKGRVVLGELGLLMYLRFRNRVFRDLVGLLGRVISLARPLPTQENNTERRGQTSIS